MICIRSMEKYKKEKEKNMKKRTAGIVLAAVILAGAAAGGVVHMKRDERITVRESVYLDKIKGAWLGKMVGVSLGIPTEFRFIGRMATEKEIPVWKPEVLLRAYVEDDLYVPMAILKEMEKGGPDLSPKELAIGLYPYGFEFWNMHYGIFEKGIAPPDSGHPSNNPYPDGLSYSFAADYTGLIAPGQPNSVIEMTENHGTLLIYGDGIYGGTYIGAMYAEALINDNIREIIQAGLDAVPEDSWMYSAISDTISWYDETPEDLDAVYNKLMVRYFWDEEYNWISWPYGGRTDGAVMDSKLNCAYITLALLYGNGDVEKTLSTAIRLGADSDCNPSNALGILFTTMGYEAVDEKYKEMLDPERKFVFADMSFEEAVEAVYDLGKKMAVKNGGAVKEDNGEEVLIIKPQKALPKEAQNSRTPEPLSGSRFTEEEMSRMVKASIQDPDFELAWHDEVLNPWRLSWQEGTEGRIERGLGTAWEGENNVELRNRGTNWAELSQPRIQVEKNTDYILSCYVQTADDLPGAVLGVRKPVYEGGELIETKELGVHEEYTKVELRFNSQDQTCVDIYVGFRGTGEMARVKLDHFDLSKAD